MSSDWVNFERTFIQLKGVKTLLIKKVGNRCQDCGFIGKIVLHHNIRKADKINNNSYTYNDFRLLCDGCHGLRHRGSERRGRNPTLIEISQIKTSIL